MPQPGEDGRQIGKQQGRRPVIAAVEPADDGIPRPAQPAVHAHAKAAGKIFGNVELASVPEENVHEAERGMRLKDGLRFQIGDLRFEI